MEFAKLFGSGVNQVLAVMDADPDNDGEVQISISCTPHADLGVCTIRLGFQSDENGDAWNKAQVAFDLLNHEIAKDYVKKTIYAAADLPFPRVD